MGFIYEERVSDSPYVETVMVGRTAGAGSVIRPAEIHWHMVMSRQKGSTQLFFVGPLTTAGVVAFDEGVELLWIKFRLGAFMPHLPARKFLDVETSLPSATSQSFWLKGSAWQFPDYENVDTFVDRLAREEILVCEPVVDAVLQEQPHELSARTVRHRFLQATGLTQNQVRQFERAQWAAARLRQGMSILDTVYEAGYFDQPHLTRSLKRWIGYTPAQLIEMSKPSCHSVQDNDLSTSYDTGVLVAV